MAIDLNKYKLKNNLDKYKIKQEPIEPVSEGATGLKGFGVGLLKGLGSTLKGIGTIGTKIGAGVTAAFDPNRTYGEVMKGGYGLDILNPETEAGKRAEEALTATTTSQKVGKGIEQIAEFFIPASKLAKADKALDLIISGSKLPKGLQTATKVAGKAGIEGLGAGGVTLAQTGGDLKEAGKTALTGGVLSAGVRGAGQVIKSINIPEKLYSRIFKNELSAIKSEYRAGGLSRLAKSDPEKYTQAVESGLFKNGVLNENLAKQALDRGLKGSLDTMARKVMDDTIELEMQALKSVKNKKIALTGLKLKNLTSTLDDVASDYKRIGSGEIGDVAKSFSDLIKQGKGKISGKQLLDLRRFMDGMRYKSSYTTTNKLSMGQENMKYWSDALRNKVNNIPGVGNIMKDYSFNIKAFDSIVKAAARNKNNNILGLLDTVMLGTGNIIPALAIKGSRTAAVSTNIAQGLKAMENIPQTISGGIIGSTARGITPQE